MKYWYDNGGSIDLIGIELSDPVEEGSFTAFRVLSIALIDAMSRVRFEEGCDHYFSIDLPVGDAILALEEAIAWLKEKGDQ